MKVEDGENKSVQGRFRKRKKKKHELKWGAHCWLISMCKSGGECPVWCGVSRIRQNKDQGTCCRPLLLGPCVQGGGGFLEKESCQVG